MRHLRTQNETNIAASLLSYSTWNSDDFWSEIQQRTPCSRRVPPCCESIPASTTNSKHDWGGFWRELLHRNGALE